MTRAPEGSKRPRPAAVLFASAALSGSLGCLGADGDPAVGDPSHGSLVQTVTATDGADTITLHKHVDGTIRLTYIFADGRARTDLDVSLHSEFVFKLGGGDDTFWTDVDDATIDVTVHAGPGDDRVEGASTVDGGPGADTIKGAKDQPNHLQGGANDDILIGGSEDDLIEGQGGRDILFGLDGGDDLRGGDDQDRLFGGPGDDDLDGGEAADKACGEGGKDVLDLHAGSEGDRGRGGAGDDVQICDDADDCASTEECPVAWYPGWYTELPGY